MADLYDVLRSKYAPSASEEGSAMDESDKAILEKNQRLAKLKFVSAEGEKLETTTRNASSLAPMFPSLDTVVLSKTQLSSWKEAFGPIEVFPKISTLDISYNPLPLPLQVPSSSAFLTTLSLNGCGLSWKDLCVLAAPFPQLQELYVYDNKITDVDSQDVVFPFLKKLSIEGNGLRSWKSVQNILSAAPKLEVLYASNNELGSEDYDYESIKFDPPKLALKELSISNNRLESWEQVSRISQWFSPSLKALRISGNPVFGELSPTRQRIAVLARISGLELLNGSVIRPIELREAEKLVKSESSSAQTSGAKTSPTCSGFPTVTLQCNVAAASKGLSSERKRLPLGMRVAEVRTLCRKLFGIPGSTEVVMFYVEPPSAASVGSFPQPMDNENVTLEGYGIADGSKIVIELKN